MCKAFGVEELSRRVIVNCKYFKKGCAGLWDFASLGSWLYGIYDRTGDAHNEVTLISFCKDHLKAVAVPFEGKLPYNKHKSFSSIFFFRHFVTTGVLPLLLAASPSGVHGMLLRQCSRGMILMLVPHGQANLKAEALIENTGPHFLATGVL